MSDSTISYDPKDYYEKDLKDRFKENAEKYFDGCNDFINCFLSFYFFT